MPAFLLCVNRFFRLLLSCHQVVAIENAALRLQLAAFRRNVSRLAQPARTTTLVQADTVVRWQREHFRKFFARLSRVDRRRCGRPAVAVEIPNSSSRWWQQIRCGVRRGFAENLKCLASGSLSARFPEFYTGSADRRPRPGRHSSQPYRPNGLDPFLWGQRHHQGMFVFILLGHCRREMLHCNVTERPTAAWTSQQIVEAFADRYRYLIRDRDSI